ncbi:hypothetical protein Q7M85_05035 [Candidatus Liberibacter asiaticus]
MTRVEFVEMKGEVTMLKQKVDCLIAQFNKQQSVIDEFFTILTTAKGFTAFIKGFISIALPIGSFPALRTWIIHHVVGLLKKLFPF